MVMAWLCHGYVMVMLWLCYGYVMVVFDLTLADVIKMRARVARARLGLAMFDHVWL